MKKIIVGRVCFLLIISVSLTAFGLFCFSYFAKVSGEQDKGWKVWVKTSPCSGGRTDWISVAKENPSFGSGGSFHTLADQLVSGFACTTVSDQSCSFAAATAVAASIRLSGKFASYCCRDYAVWENTQSKELSAVKGFGSAGFGWRFVRGNLCCEEAEAITGKTGLCGGTNEGGKKGYIGCFKDTSAFDLDGLLVRSQNNTPQLCTETCRAKSFKYAAVQYGESCLCGNSYGKYGAADNCNYKCTGDAGQICGGYSANSIYTTEILKVCDYFLSPVIYDKWMQSGGKNGKLGCPAKNEIEAEKSLQGTTGQMIRFSKGDGGFIIRHDSGKFNGTAFEVSGCMFKLYANIGGTKSWLGFPVNDEFSTSGGARQDFENG